MVFVAALLAVTTSGITNQPGRARAATIGLGVPADFLIGQARPTGAATASGAYLFSDYAGTGTYAPEARRRA